MIALWPREFGQSGGYLQRYRCLDEGRKIAARSWPKLDLVSYFSFRTGVNLATSQSCVEPSFFGSQCDKVGIDGLRP